MEGKILLAIHPDPEAFRLQARLLPAQLPKML